MAFSSIHVTRASESSPPLARITEDGGAIVTVISGDAEVVFSDPRPDRLATLLYAMAREVVRVQALATMPEDANMTAGAWGK
jgi:hypothetical protein